MSRFQYLRYGLAAVLAFAALKLVLRETLELHPLVSVAVIVACIGAAALVSALRRVEPGRHRTAWRGRSSSPQSSVPGSSPQ
jgi:tellurite resistance protein TerC